MSFERVGELEVLPNLGRPARRGAPISSRKPITSQSDTYLSQLPLTIVLPSFEAPSAQTLASWPMSMWLGVGGVSEGASEEGRGQTWMSLS